MSLGLVLATASPHAVTVDEVNKRRSRPRIAPRQAGALLLGMDPDLHSGAGGHVEGRCELGVAVADQKPGLAARVLQVQEEMASELYRPRCGGVCGGVQDSHAAGSAVTISLGIICGLGLYLTTAPFWRKLTRSTRRHTLERHSPE